MRALFILLFLCSTVYAGERTTLEKGDSTEIGTSSNPVYVYDVNSVGGLYGTITPATANQIPYYTGTRTVGGGVLYQNSGNIGVNKASPTQQLDVNGSVQFSGSLISTSTTNIGVTLQTHSNQSCNTTCTYGAVGGQNTDAAPYAIVGPTDGTADRCWCLGPS